MRCQPFSDGCSGVRAGHDEYLDTYWFQARCTCGFDGPKSPSREYALEEMVEHLAAAIRTAVNE